MATLAVSDERFIRDDFAGARGWSEGLAMLGLSDVGVENVKWPHLTAQAAGHRSWLVDIRQVRDFVWRVLWGYIASPPCQTFTLAGNGSGRKHMDSLLLAIKLVADGWTPEEAVAYVSDEALDERSILVLEPLLVIREHDPVWVALEQVPQVLPIWEAFAEVLRGWGYHVWTGLLYAEEYGVPQTRKRAVLMAHHDREVAPPAPTHTRYRKGAPRQAPGLLPWVSMADALSWGMTQRSYPTAAVPGDTSWAYDRPSPTIVGTFAPDVVAAPGYRKAGDGPRQSQPGSIRITVQEAAILQSFRASYPWQGPKSAQYQQVGNAIPPLLARAILTELTRP